MDITDFEKRFRNISLELALKECCLLVERSAKEKCPVDTGELRSSITFSVSGNKGTVGTNVEYAPYVEFGTGIYSVKGDGRKDVPWRYQDVEGNWHTTSGQVAQPFLYPALEENRSEIKKILLKRIQEAIRND